MKRLIEFPLEEGGSVIIEVVDGDTSGTMDRASRSNEIVAKAGHTLETALERVKPAAEAILKQITHLSELPSEIEVEFGLKVTAEVGAIIASGSVEANYIVKLKWTREQIIK